MSSAPIEHQHEDGTWHPGVGARDCDHCADVMYENRLRSRSKFADKNVGFSVSKLTMQREMEGRKRPRRGTLAHQRFSEERLERNLEAMERMGDRDTRPRMSLESSFRAARDQLQHQKNLRGEK